MMAFRLASGPHGKRASDRFAASWAAGHDSPTGEPGAFPFAMLQSTHGR